MDADTSLATRPGVRLSLIDLIIHNCSAGAYVYFSMIKGEHTSLQLMMCSIIIYNREVARAKLYRHRTFLILFRMFFQFLPKEEERNNPTTLLKLLISKF